MSNKAFSFGKNWQSYLDNHLSGDSYKKSVESLEELFGKERVRGKKFLDIGCGSGLFSLAAFKLGAKRIVSFDVDVDSVNCCRYLMEKEKSPKNWKIFKESILNDNLVNKLEKFDIVYSYGVLHHTGNMWKAIENSAKFVSDNGLLYLAIYNKADSHGFYSDYRFGTSKFWEKEKRFYSGLPSPLQSLIDYLTIGFLFIAYLFTFKNPVKIIKDHNRFRGMSWKVDIKDWLGGYPYEYASPEEIFNFVSKMGFSLEKIKTNNGLMNNEFLFKKTVEQ